MQRFSPVLSFVRSSALVTASEYDLTMTLNDASGKNILAYSPVKHDENAKLPDIVKPPLRPAEIKNNEECYLVGLRNLQFHNPFVDPAEYFEEVLRRDPFDTRANTKMGVYWRERGDNANFYPTKDGRCRVRVQTNLSRVFYSWVSTFEDEIVIEKPQRAIEGFKEHLRKCMSKYTDEI